MARTAASTRARRLSPGDVVTLTTALIVSLLSSPLTAIYAVVIGIPFALVAWVLHRITRRSGARILSLATAGVVLGAISYLLLGLVVGTVGSAGSAGQGTGG